MNVFLLLFFSYRAYLLYCTLSLQNIAVRSPLEYNFMEIKRPKIAARFGPVSDLFATGGGDTSTPSAGPSESKAPRPSARLNELSTGDKVIRVIGIFITKTGRYAAVAMSEQDKAGAGYVQLKKVTVGNRLRGYTIVSISPGYIKLQSGASKEVILGIFKDSHQ